MRVGCDSIYLIVVRMQFLIGQDMLIKRLERQLNEFIRCEWTYK